VKKPATTIVAVAAAVAVAIVGLSVFQKLTPEQRCGDGFVRDGARCLVPKGACPKPLVKTPAGCEAPADDVALVPETTVTIGPSDWEAEGRVKPRSVHVKAFRLDRFEASDSEARALSRVTLAEARAACAKKGGRLPTEDEWIVAAAGDRPRRYPWGDTGAVCRRAAWGLVSGPCGSGAAGPDTVGAHPDGDSPLGIHDLAGNVAEWVDRGANEASDEAKAGVVRGGSYRSSLATELRTWVRDEPKPDAREAWIGYRCAYTLSGP
jgi:formylglycine-generating enzyme required for sulfatase activity